MQDYNNVSVAERYVTIVAYNEEQNENKKYQNYTPKLNSCDYEQSSESKSVSRCCQEKKLREKKIKITFLKTSRIFSWIKC